MCVCIYYIASYIPTTPENNNKLEPICIHVMSHPCHFIEIHDDKASLGRSGMISGIPTIDFLADFSDDLAVSVRRVELRADGQGVVARRRYRCKTQEVVAGNVN
jgi:predicted metal-dependent RNase